jgi:hypothetical protein
MASILTTYPIVLGPSTSQSDLVNLRQRNKNRGKASLTLLRKSWRRKLTQRNKLKIKN